MPGWPAAAPRRASRPRGSMATITCHWHPDRETGLHCTNCGKPMCVECMRQHPVGMRCKECSRQNVLPTYQISTSFYARGIAAALGPVAGAGEAVRGDGQRAAPTAVAAQAAQHPGQAGAVESPGLDHADIGRQARLHGAQAGRLDEQQDMALRFHSLSIIRTGGPGCAAAGRGNRAPGRGCCAGAAADSPRGDSAPPRSPLRRRAGSGGGGRCA